MNSVCSLLNIKYPIIQGGMAWIADAGLASAVSNAGGLGLIAAGNAPAEYVREQVRRARLLTDKPFGVNIMLMSPTVADVVKVILEEGVKVVTTGAGSPQTYMQDFIKAGIAVIPVIASVAQAKKMEKCGAAAIVAEGMEAGGHIGKLTTMALVPQVADAVAIPVIAAGGIADGRGMAAAFMLGASGVQIGTRFLVANECPVHENYKDAVIKAKDIDTVITGALTGHSVRGIKNSLTREYEAVEKVESKKDSPDIERLEALGTGRLRMAVVEGDTKNGSVFSGQIAGLVSKKQDAAEIIREIMSQYAECASRHNVPI